MKPIKKWHLQKVPAFHKSEKQNTGTRFTGGWAHLPADIPKRKRIAQQLGCIFSNLNLFFGARFFYALRPMGKGTFRVKLAYLEGAKNL